MMEFNLSKHRRGRVWLNEPLPCEFVSIDVVRVEMDPGNEACGSVISGAVELFVPEGGRFSYALVGGKFQSSDSANRLSIVVGVGEGGLKYPAALSGNLDDVQIGLPQEYVAAVSEGLALGRNVLPAGKLEVSCAAHGRSGSSAKIFRRVATLLMMILCLSPGDADPSTLSRLLEQ